MERYTIIVNVEAHDQNTAFRFVEAAIADLLDKQSHRSDDSEAGVQVTTPDGTQSVVF